MVGKRIVDCTSSTGRAVRLGKQIGQPGGEGTIYAIEGQRGAVAKIYHEPLTGDKIVKLSHLCSLAEDPRLGCCGMPRELLVVNGIPRGFAMPFFAGSKELHLLSSPTSRRREFPKIRFDFLVHVARNLAAEVENVHAAGLVIGDVNCRGFLVSARGLVHLIDCDSFQVRHQGRTFRCDVGMPEYLAPELHTGASLGSFDRTPDHDAFALGVLVFQLLFQDRHPYFGVPLDPQEPHLELGEIIRRHRFAYGARATQAGVRRPPLSLSLADLSPGLRDCFERTFHPDAARLGRPGMAAWRTALEDAGRQLVECPTDRMHRFFAAAGECPWCRIEGDGGPHYFPSSQGVSGPVVLAGQALVERARRLLALHRRALIPREFPDLAPSPDIVDLFAAIDRRLAFYRSVSSWAFILLLLLGILTLGACSQRHDSPAFAWFLTADILLLFLGFIGAALAKDRPILIARRGEPLVIERTLRLNALTLSITDRNWQVNTLTQHEQAVTNLDRLITAHTEAVTEHRAQLAGIHANAREFQLNEYLERISLRTVKIPQVGPAQLSLLTFAGVTTAADLRRGRHLVIQGMPRTILARLDAWLESLMATFKYNPRRPAGVAQIDDANDHHLRLTTRLEQDLAKAMARLDALRPALEKISPAEAASLSQAYRDLRQTEVDLAQLARKT